jgi:hypothetical protein
MTDETLGEGASLGSTIISRRKLIQAGAIVGGVAWAAPVIDSFASPASAGSSLSGCYVCLDGKGNPFFSGADDPGPGEASASCSAEALRLSIAGPGTYVLFNTTDTNGAWVANNFGAHYCEYGLTNGGSPAELNNSCPATYTVGGAHPALVTCVTGSWS